ncbi:hypothetical protein Ancab_038956 [Ancistrocladus abbreviatus]
MEKSETDSAAELMAPVVPTASTGGGRFSRMINNKWAATVASIWIQSTSGTPSTFGIYSSVLKSSQSYSQSTLDTIALFKDLGANVGILAGLLYTAVTHTRPYLGGPRVVILAGAVQCFLGYFLTWLTVTGAIYQPPVAVVCLFMFFAGHSMPFMNTANVVTSVHNFRDHTGTAIGIMKGFLGLSGAILIQVYRTIFKGNPTSFLLLVAMVSTVNPLWLMWFVKIYKTYGGNEKQHLNGFSLVIVAIAAYLVATIILESIITLQLWARILILSVLLLMVASPLYIVLRVFSNNSHEATKVPSAGSDTSQLDTENLHERGDNMVYHHLPSFPGQEEDSVSKTSEVEENLNLCQAMSTINFWLLFLGSACGLGSGLAVLNNITQIGESLGYSSTETSTLVSLWGIWNSLGRFGAGYLSDYILHVRGWPRPLFMAITLATMSVGHALIASGLPGALYAGSILAGICYGSQLSLMPTVASEIFGVVNMGTIFNTITIAGPVGSYLLSVRLVGYIYDKEASGHGNTCTGVHCFMLSFFIMAGVTLVGSLVAMILYLRTKMFYEQIIFRRLQRYMKQ